MFDAIIASICIAFLSLVGVCVFGTKGHLTGSHRFILPTAVGIFIGIIFFELVPETIAASHTWGPVAIVIGFLGFYFLSHLLDTYRHHHFSDADGCSNHSGARKLLIGDGIHNFADGIVIASAFMINPVVGIFTTLGIALHEIPQEIAEFGVLLHSGYTRKKAAFYNFISATSVVVGVCATFIFSEFFATYTFVLSGIAAGNLLYIATADLIPELRETHREHFIHTFFATVIGVILVAFLIEYTHSLLG